MKVYLVQHGQSVSEEIDPARPLSEQGRNDLKKVAQFLKGMNLKISVILQSGKTRAAQTAEILNPKVTSFKGIMKRDGLAPNDPVDPWVDELHKARDDFMLVGHLPFLSKLATRLLGGKEGQEFIDFQPGGVICLERVEGDKWRIRWIVVPELLNIP